MIHLLLTPTKLATERVSGTHGSGLLIHQDTFVVEWRAFHTHCTTSFVQRQC